MRGSGMVVSSEVKAWREFSAVISIWAVGEWFEDTFLAAIVSLHCEWDANLRAISVSGIYDIVGTSVLHRRSNATRFVLGWCDWMLLVASADRLPSRPELPNSAWALSWPSRVITRSSRLHAYWELQFFSLRATKRYMPDDAPLLRETYSPQKRPSLLSTKAYFI